MPAEDFITCDFPDLDSFIRQLDLFNDHVNKALVAGMYTGADMIKNEQKRLISGKSRRLSAAIDKSEIEVTKSGSLKVTSGYQADSFEIDDNGFNPGVVGMTYEFGRPGQSNNTRRRDEYRYWSYYNKKGTFVFMKQRKGTIQPVPHIRRGFDNVKDKVARTIIEVYNRELDKLEKG